MVGRFLNADAYVSTGQGILGNNMFAYCGNNPINGIDPLGRWTLSFGFGLSAFLGAGASYSYTVAFDGHGNFASQISKANVFKDGSGGTFGLCSAGASIITSYSKLDTVDDLEGESLNVGGSVTVGVVSVGGELISSVDEEPEVLGGTAAVGVGVGIDVHATASKTETIQKFNIIEEAKKVWNKFWRWF